MSEVVEVAMGDLIISPSPLILSTSSIGSCIAICLHSHTHHAGALAHIMLPKRPETGNEIVESDKKYADIALAVMVSELEKNGITKDRLTAKIVGGANMFPDVQGRSHKIGEKNIEAVKTLLIQYGIHLAAEETGGSTGRALTFDLANGIVTIKITI